MEETEGRRDGRRDPEATPYRLWQQAEGIPINRGAFVTNLHTAEVADWPRFGQKGAFVNLADQEHDDGYVLEIAAGGETKVQHHLFEVLLYVLSGRGATTFWQKGSKKQTVEWQRGSVFSPPLNCYYQHFNLDGQQPARLFAVTSAPTMINLYRNPAFIFDDDFVFADRYDVRDDYFTDPGRSLGTRVWKTNFIPDVRAFKLDEWPEHGPSAILNFELANNGLAAHIMESPAATYPKAHRHNVGAHVIVLDGKGYSLLWYEGHEKEMTRVDWTDGTVLSPREMEFHQHLNTSPQPVRFLAFRLGGIDLRASVRSEDWRRQIDGIPYESQDPEIYETFSRECEKNGAKVMLPRPSYEAYAGKR